MALNFSTVRSYDYFSLKDGINISFPPDNAGATISFSDSIQLQSFPFTDGAEIMGPVTGYTLLGGFYVDTPVPITIIWLNKTYSGVVTLNSSGIFSLVWNNSGAVKFRQ